MLTPWAVGAAATVFGAVIGSFLNVIIYRLPRGESIVKPASHCPHCGSSIAPWDNIPILSFIVLRGRCRHCHRPITFRYPLVETANALLYLSVFLCFGIGFQALVWATYCSALIVVSAIDIDHRIIPDVITLPGMALGIVTSFWMPRTSLDSLLALLAGGGFFYLVAVLSRGGMGGGDIKLTAMMGSFLGLKSLAVAVFIGLLSGSLISLVLMLMGRKTRKDIIPFGPFLALGGISVVFWGKKIIHWYVNIRYY
jgi:leader peptidase (prepilin peptidase)/N-methyltransferase